jgi:polysaccharide export outer membrane protein
VVLLGTLALVVLAGCQNPPAGNGSKPATDVPAPTRSQIRSTAPVTLAAGDVVRFAFPGAVEFNNSQKIRIDGRISLPVIGEVQAAGKTLEQLRRELSGLYKQHLTNSEVVATLESGGARVVVSGAVAKPGTLPLQGTTTVLQAIMESGGFTELANQRKVHLIRDADGEHRTEILDLRAAMKGQPTRVITVRPGDMIYVPTKFW